MKKIVRFSLILAIFSAIIFTFYCSRQFFPYRYNPAYYDHYYYHSQWNIPNSTRGISDGELYKFVGYRLASGENPFNINFEIPPFTKLLYGLAEKYISNPYWVSFFIYISSVIILFLFAKHLYGKSTISLLAVLLFVVTPFVSTQVRETMLDLPLMFFFLLQSYFFVLYLSNKKNLNLLLSAFFLGLATGSKPGVFSPSLVLICLFVLSLNKSPTNKKIKNIFFYLFFTFTGYCFAFISYFIKHQNPIPWLRLHQKQLDFYLLPKSVVDHFAVFKNIFLNQCQNITSFFSLKNYGDLSPLLIIGTILLIPLLIHFIKTKKYQWLYLVLFCLNLLIICSCITFFPRYLMPIIPIYVLLIGYVFQNKKFLFLLLIIISLPSFYLSMAIDKVDGHIEAVARFISTRNYPELFRSLKFDEKINEDNFSISLENFYNQVDVKKIEISIDHIDQSSKDAKSTLNIIYKTNSGDIQFKKTIISKKINNEWKTYWNWDLLYPEYNPTLSIFNVSKNNQKITEIYAIPQLMYDWSNFLNRIQGVSTNNITTLDSNIKRVVPDKYPRYIGVLITIDHSAKALLIPGVSLHTSNTASQIYFIKQNQKIYLIK